MSLSFQTKHVQVNPEIIVETWSLLYIYFSIFSSIFFLTALSVDRTLGNVKDTTV